MTATLRRSLMSGLLMNRPPVRCKGFHGRHSRGTRRSPKTSRAFSAVLHSEGAVERAAGQDNGRLGHFARQRRHIVVGELNEAAHLQPRVGHAGALRSRRNTAFLATSNSFSTPLRKAPARPQQHHQHKNAPVHAKRGEARGAACAAARYPEFPARCLHLTIYQLTFNRFLFGEAFLSARVERMVVRAFCSARRHQPRCCRRFCWE